MTEYRVTVYGDPRPWQSQHRGSPRTPGFMAMQKYQLLIQVAIKEQLGNVEPLTGPVRLEIAFYRAHTGKHIPPEDPVKLQAFNLKHIGVAPDLTNCLKAAEDALKGLLFVDDKQVIETHCSKGFDDEGEGKTVIRVSEILSLAGQQWPPHF
mgnify:CR=1 FL=1